jgi:hypothetical protein
MGVTSLLIANMWSDYGGRELCLEEQRCTLASKTSAKEVVAHILQMEERVQLKVVLLLWLWCSERNGVREGEHRRTTSDLTYVVHKNAEEFLELRPRLAINVFIPQENESTDGMGWSPQPTKSLGGLGCNAPTGGLGCNFTQVAGGRMWVGLTSLVTYQVESNN